MGEGAQGFQGNPADLHFGDPGGVVQGMRQLLTASMSLSSVLICEGPGAPRLRRRSPCSPLNTTEPALE